jgi:hypothetical protein
MDAEVAAALASVVALGDEPTEQEVMLGEAVERVLAARSSPDRPRVPLELATTVELLDELRRRVINEGGSE